MFLCLNLESGYRNVEEPPSITFELCGNNIAYHHSIGNISISGDCSISEDGKLDLSEATAGVHFLSRDSDDDGHGCIVVTKCEEADSEELLMESTVTRSKHELLEYQMQEDGTVVCKWCGEVLPSRTHWYRHKYKFHVPSTVPAPANLYKCHRCNVFFKSRKGYIGHMASRHGEQPDPKEEGEVRRRSARNTAEVQREPDYEKQREREEKLVADIIDRVRRECEAQGAAVTRRGYSRRTTVMNS